MEMGFVECKRGLLLWRLLEFNNENLVAAIFIQTFPFAMPGILIGGLSAALLNAVFRYFIFN